MVNAEVSSLRAEIGAANHLVENYRALASEVANLFSRVSDANSQISSLRALVDEHRAKTSELSQILVAKDVEANARMLALRAEVEVGDVLIDEYRGRISELEGSIQDLERRNAPATSKNESPGVSSEVSATITDLYNELAAYRNSLAQRVVYQFRSDRLWPIISPAFSHLKIYSAQRLRRWGHRLSLSPDLRSMKYREYKMPVVAQQLTAIDLAIVPIIRCTGRIGIELVSAKGKVLAQSVMDLANISSDCPTRFVLLDRISLSPKWALRVFVHGATSPIAVYELVHPALFRRRPRIRAFAALIEEL
jgi:hypothetical protein